MKLAVPFSLALLAAFAASPAYADAAKKKTKKKPVSIMESLPPQIVIYDPDDPAGPAAVLDSTEPKVPNAPLIFVTTDKEAGKGVAEEKDVAIEKGKKK
jgi:hypothetical protein